MARTGRPKAELVVSDEERLELKRATLRARVTRDLAFRARLILACMEERSNVVVAARHRCSVHNVGKWRARFSKNRLEDLCDDPRVGVRVGSPTTTLRP